jgi:mono/diheme cytochrome c family protein
MRKSVLIMLVAACSTQPTKKSLPPDAHPRTYDAEIPRLEPAPTLPPVEGASVEAGAPLFTKLCSRCHGNQGKGDGPDAAALPIAPTDITQTFYLCHSTIGTPAMPSDLDVESQLERGVHAAERPIQTLDPVAKRSLTLYVKSLSNLAKLTPEPVVTIPTETPDDDASRKRGRVMFLAVGCWKCHGTEGAGDGAAASSMGWNAKRFEKLLPLGKLAPVALCGRKPDEVYRAILLGVGDRPRIMPGYDSTTMLLSRPNDADDTIYTRPLVGKVPEPDRLAVQELFSKLPIWVDVQKMSEDARRARQIGWMWDLVHYVESL